MTEFTKKIITGNPRAIAYAKTLLTDPALVFKMNGVPFFIPLEVETCQQTGDAVVSEQLVITSEGKKYISDNIAPSPWSWTISGYLSGTEALEPTNFFKPSVQFQADVIRKAFKEGILCYYKDIDCRPYDNVAIQSLTIETRGECQNKKPFQMVLKQVEVLESKAGAITRIEALSSPESGSAGGTTAEFGQGGTVEIGNSGLKNIGDEVKAKLKK